MKSSVLISSAGRRVELVQAFKDALKILNNGSKVYCTDMQPQLSSACQIADGYFKVPRVTENNYVELLLDICKVNNIGLVVPTIDTELIVLSKNRQLFENEGVYVVISDEELVNKCRDKRKTANLFDELKIEQPLILDRNNLTFPCFCKPYDGSCSIGAIAIQSKYDLTEDQINNPKNMFMELVPKSYCEYTIDAYYSKDGNLKCLVPRKRLEVRGGEVSKGITKRNFVYEYLYNKVKSLKGARGCITFQLFVNEELELIKGLEINPRFGGGYPLTHDSGANFPQWLISEYLYKVQVGHFDSWEEDLTMLRYDAKVLVRGNK
ncbi:ATP-grasp domain-containing protein [Vibrio diazotrophicus]|uniref:ATP-grasp domain-containing protein n=1 Tax=Vibrio diazotrophicus TaxID=685 RepID=UPI000C9E62D2|nr:ATP-grasp domain-containing protein [Vibrio diazotrophicus]PNH80574.1 carbamoyl phosphate synthase large subunit [Vibrio diazotrophicus]